MAILGYVAVVFPVLGFTGIAVIQAFSRSDNLSQHARAHGTGAIVMNVIFFRSHSRLPRSKFDWIGGGQGPSERRSGE